MPRPKLILSVAAGVAAIVVLGGAAMTSATVVNIADPTIPARVAHVDAGNRLAVQEVPPSTYFHSSTFAMTSTSGCVTIATPPAGKALIVRQVRVVVFSETSGGNVYMYPNATCTNPPVGDASSPAIGQNSVTFDPGVSVSAESGFSANVVGGVEVETYVDGYTVAPSVAPMVGQMIQVRGRSGQK